MFSVIIALRRFHSSLSCYVMDFTSWFHVMVLVCRISLLIYNIMYLLNICNFKDHVHLFTSLYVFLYQLFETALHTLFIGIRIISIFDVFLSVLYPVVLSFIDLFAFIKIFRDHWRTISLISIYAGTFGGDTKYFILKCFIRDGYKCQIFISICKIILKTSFTEWNFTINISLANRNMFIISFWKRTIWNTFNATGYSPSLLFKEFSIASECYIFGYFVSHILNQDINIGLAFSFCVLTHFT